MFNEIQNAALIYRRAKNLLPLERAAENAARWEAFKLDCVNFTAGRRVTEQALCEGGLDRSLSPSMYELRFTQVCLQAADIKYRANVILLRKWQKQLLGKQAHHTFG